MFLMCALFELAIPVLRTNPTSTCTSQQKYMYIYIMNLGTSVAMAYYSAINR